MSFCIAINQNVIIGIKKIKSRFVWAKRYKMCAGKPDSLQISNICILMNSKRNESPEMLLTVIFQVKGPKDHIAHPRISSNKHIPVKL